MTLIRRWICFCTMKHLYCSLIWKGQDPLFSISQFMGMGSFIAPGGLLPPLSLGWITIDSFIAFFSSPPDTASPSHAAFSVENNLLFQFSPFRMWTPWCHWLCSSSCIYVLWCSEESYACASYPRARSGHLSVWRLTFFCFGNKLNMHLLSDILNKLFFSFRDLRWA